MSIDFLQKKDDFLQPESRFLQAYREELEPLCAKESGGSFKRMVELLCTIRLVRYITYDQIKSLGDEFKPIRKRAKKELVEL